MFNPTNHLTTDLVAGAKELEDRIREYTGLRGTVSLCVWEVPSAVFDAIDGEISTFTNGSRCKQTSHSPWLVFYEVRPGA